MISDDDSVVGDDVFSTISPESFLSEYVADGDPMVIDDDLVVEDDASSTFSTSSLTSEAQNFPVHFGRQYAAGADFLYERVRPTSVVEILIRTGSL